ncbi:MAG: glycine cleavage system protein H [Bacteroidales bacterium]|nr:glycine cleavage system protein H [Bacteroidales bacterium]
MDAFSYTDIFDTKGIEYIIVIGFLLLTIPVWMWLNKPVNAVNKFADKIQAISLEVLRIPHGLMFDRNHTWAFLERSGQAKVGIDDLLLHITGGVSVDYLKKNGEKIEKGEVIASLEQEGKKLDIASPISGVIKGANMSLKEDRGKINQDPYGKGWLYRIEPEKWKTETAACLMSEDAEEWAKNELERVKDFFSGSFGKVRSADLPPVVLQEGGELKNALLAEMPEDIWRKFQSEILD